jgi:protein TonB
MAQLAYEAGMLVEPEDYSAWTLFARVLTENPDSTEATAGLEAVSDELIRRADVALEQGRFADAEAAMRRILDVLPEHDAALALATEIERIKPKPAPPREPPPVVTRAPEPRERERPVIAAPSVTAPARPVAPPVDPLVELDKRFATAMRENRLLTPAGDNARSHVQVMLDTNSTDERTLAAQALLSEELLARSTQALEALDPDAARSWIDAADAIAPNPTAVAAARAKLDARLIEIETAKPLPASSLTIASYVAPEYPSRALQRDIEGWVDVEFTVAANGAVQEVVVAETSHQMYFGDEAVSAVSQWRFEPRIFMGQAIPQRSYTRIRFTLAD